MSVAQGKTCGILDQVPDIGGVAVCVGSGGAHHNVMADHARQDGVGAVVQLAQRLADDHLIAPRQRGDGDRFRVDGDGIARGDIELRL